MPPRYIDTLKGDRVLLSPLNWGLGHATRCVPIVNALLSSKKHVIIAGYGRSGDYLKARFPELEYIDLPGIEFEYSKGNSQVGAVIRQMGRMIKKTREENALLERIIKEKKIDIVISDNRFGLYSKLCHCIYITHQLMIKAPQGLSFLEPLLWRLHGLYIKRYDECWVPDYEGEANLSGDLSHKYPLHDNVKFIGALSRFSCMNDDEPTLKRTFEHLVIISGPEPHRSIFEHEATSGIAKWGNLSSVSTLIVQGKPECGTEIKQYNDRTFIVGHLEDSNFKYQVENAKHIYCRSGYSTIMDLAYLKRKATFIPTPGQTEQEYLATQKYPTLSIE